MKNGARLEALKTASLIFLQYAELHREKGTLDGDEKARRNQDLHEQMEKALALSGDFSIGSDVWPGLGKLVEEAGETNTVLGKLIGTCGDVHYWDGRDLGEEATDEIADLYAILDFFVEQNSHRLDRPRILFRRMEKKTLYEKWQRDPHARKLPGKPEEPAFSHHIVEMSESPSRSGLVFAKWSDGYENSIDLRNYPNETEETIRGRLQNLRTVGHP